MDEVWSNSKILEKPIRNLKQNSIFQEQYDLFDIKESDEKITMDNKLGITCLMSELETKSLLLAAKLSDYQSMNDNSSSSSTIYDKIVQFQNSPPIKTKSSSFVLSHLMHITDTSEPNTFCERLQTYLTLQKHKNLIQFEGVFFDELEGETNKKSDISINFVLKNIKTKLGDWLLCKNPQKKPKFQEIGQFLLQILEMIKFYHQNQIFGLDLNFSEILINQDNECCVSCFRYFFMKEEPIHQDTQNLMINDFHLFGKLLKTIFIGNSDLEITKSRILQTINKKMDTKDDNIEEKALIKLEKLLSMFLGIQNEDQDQKIDLDIEIAMLESVFFNNETSEDVFLKALKFEEGDFNENELHERDYLKARSLLSKLSQNGFLPATFWLGFHDALGLSGHMDLNQGTSNCKKSRKQFLEYLEAEACLLPEKYKFCCLGIAYEQQCAEKAINFFQKSADLGHSLAMSKLGVIYLNSSDEKASLLLENASKLGNCIAQYEVAEEQLEGALTSFEKPKAMKLLELSAKQDFVPAICYLAIQYQLDPRLQRNKIEAWKLFEKAADCGHSGAQYLLGNMFLSGKVPGKSSIHAIECYKAAARQGSCEAIDTLAKLYTGSISLGEDQQTHQLAATHKIKRDLSKALHYRKLDAKHSTFVCSLANSFFLGRMYEFPNVFGTQDCENNTALAFLYYNQSQTEPGRERKDFMAEDGKCEPGEKFFFQEFD